MKKTAFTVTVAALSLAACSTPAPTTENKADAIESDLVNRAAALDNEANADANAAAAKAIDGATATYTNKAEADAARNAN